MIPRHKIDEILQTASIEEIIGEFVHLKKSGRQFKALSPFANEKTPSFYVVPEKQIFKDFSSGKGGNVVSFLMEHEHFTYPEALRFLAKKYNIELEEEERTEEQKLAEGERESLYIVTAFAEEYFQDQLNNTDEGKSVGLSYFKGRGFTDETIEKFGLGYSPDKWEAFASASKEKGYKTEYLEKSGLIKKSPKKDREFYDGYKGRVMFPIHNLSGRAIGFGARTLLTEKKIPKYLNSPESLIYNKSKILYGIYQAKGEIIKNDNCYLVEGYTDVIQFHQSGIKNVVSSSGTALTQDQIKLIKRYTANITLLYDGDAAGIKASFRGVDMILEEGMNVKMVSFPEGEDPDSYAKSHDPEDLHDFITKEAKDFIVSKAKILLDGTGNDPILRAGLIKDIVESIAKIPDGIARSVYIKECSTLLDIEEETLFTELNKIRNTELRKQSRKIDHDQYEAPIGIVGKTQKPATFENDIEVQEKELLRVLLNYGDQNIIIDKSKEESIEIDVATYILADLANDDMHMSIDTHVELMNELIDMVESDKWDIQSIMNHSNQQLSNLAAELVTTKHKLDNWDLREIRVSNEEKKLLIVVQKPLYSFKQKLVMKMITDNQHELKEAQEKNNFDLAINCQKKQLKLEAARAKLADQNGRVILI
ncbi:MAG: DNA primase [Salibacteraceae bacterium]